MIRTHFSNIVLNIPHSRPTGAEFVPYENPEQLVADVNRWTDWYTDQVFAPDRNIAPWVNVNLFRYSRFLVDVERLDGDALEASGEGIIYTNFKGNRRPVSKTESKLLLSLYRQYINSFRIPSGSLLIDCHSFPSDLAPDVDVCIGFNDDRSMPKADDIFVAVNLFREHGLKVSLNEPYSNSLTPVEPIRYKSIMIELNKRIYMDEKRIVPTRIEKVNDIINTLYRRYLGLEHLMIWH